MSPQQICPLNSCLAPELTTLPSGSTTDTSTVPPSTSFNIPPIPRQSNQGDDIDGISALKTSLQKHFEMKDLGQLNYFLGLEVLSNTDGYYLSQEKYALDLLTRAGLTDSKVTSTPLEPNAKLTPLDRVLLKDTTLYRQLVGSLVYLTVTRPDISYAVHIVSQYMSAPRSSHYVAVLHILPYIKGTLFHGLHFSAHSSLELSAFSDADWRCKKQTVVSGSSIDAEYRALADTTQEITWLHWLLSDMGVPHSSLTPLACDNSSAIQIAHNDVFHERTKHIEVDCHFIRQHITQGTIVLRSISSLDQPADLFTKSHHWGRFRDLLSKLKITSTPPS
ncbi:Retrovirus-related Pol polyprotein from transposon TNT 1-94 [Melia azedarach]|uniref:Retrovirus-related Pol polyprotein from transposon TNT 1-94 n=1 Tax=Melia azedarach TaxID=155640 RepID=A0ACC1YNN5_MELAZ|nr:Retrovirus-related Pol polyprotein from transposon TNT 1-94 [Melia azedarach]